MLGASLTSIPLTLFGLVLVTFLIGRVMPIDPTIAIAGDHAPPDVIAAVREQLGLDRPLLVQFWIYLTNLVHGDLGRSVMTSHPVTQDIAQYFPATLELATTAIIIAVVAGVPLGVLAAWWQGSRFDHVVRVISLAGQSIPVFVLGLVCLLVFYVKLGIAPGTGQLDVAYEGMVPRVTGMLVVDAALADDWDSFWDALAHLAQPALVLAYFSMAYITRMTRAFMIESLSGEYIITARAKGLSSARILWRHAFGNIAVRLVTVLALAYAGLLEGAVITETVFSWPGLGLYSDGVATERRHERGIGRNLGGGIDLSGAELVVRYLVSTVGSARHMSGYQTYLSRDWLLSETPASRAHAAWVRRYRGWLQFRTNGLAMVGLVTVVIMVLASLGAPLLALQDPTAQDLAGRLAPPSFEHWFGTDELGRDIYSRVLYGGRVTLGMVVAVVLLVAPLGLAVGSVAGYLGGFADRILMRVTDVFLAFPRLVLALAFVAALKPGITSAIIAIALTAWPPYARQARADTLTVRHSDFIAAVRLTGAGRGRIILRHVVPLCLSSVIVRVTLDMSGIILTAAALGFLGMGAQPPMPEWGTMIASSRAFILDQWWVPTIPGIAIFVASLAFNLLGDGLRDVLDPRQR